MRPGVLQGAAQQHAHHGPAAYLAAQPGGQVELLALMAAPGVTSAQLRALAPLPPAAREDPRWSAVAPPLRPPMA